MLSLPVTYIELNVKNVDTKTHTVQLYYDNSAEPVVNLKSEQVTWERVITSSLLYLKIGA